MPSAEMRVVKDAFGNQQRRAPRGIPSRMAACWYRAIPVKRQRFQL